MNDPVNLLRLFGSAPKDEKNRFIDDPRTDAFFEGLAKSTPLNPPQLLELADRLSKDPVMAPLANRIVLQAIGDIGHDRRMLEILSKVAGEKTTWGLSTRDLLARITKTYQGLSPRQWLGTIGNSWGGGGSSPHISYAYTAPGSGCTYQPPSGPSVTLAPKQKYVYSELLEEGAVEVSYVITVTCWNLNFDPIGPPDLCLQIETVTRYY